VSNNFTFLIEAYSLEYHFYVSLRGERGGGLIVQSQLFSLYDESIFQTLQN